MTLQHSRDVPEQPVGAHARGFQIDRQKNPVSSVFGDTPTWK